jgi:homoserine/homoserine lactone efflux protein
MSALSMQGWFIYVAAVLALMSTPGPSHLLMLSNSATYGYRRSLATVAGDLTANLLQMLAAGLGLAAALAASGGALLVVKWLGAAYLVWLGLRMIRGVGFGDLSVSGTTRASLRTLYLQGFLTSATNPKAIVFFAALFPQFISADESFWPQFALLSLTYILIDGVILSAYGIGADWISARLKGPARIWIGRIGGSLVIVAAALLALKTIDVS